MFFGKKLMNKYSSSRQKKIAAMDCFCLMKICEIEESTVNYFFLVVSYLATYTKTIENDFTYFKKKEYVRYCCRNTRVSVPNKNMISYLCSFLVNNIPTERVIDGSLRKI